MRLAVFAAVIALAMAAPALAGRTAAQPRCSPPSAKLSADGHGASAVGGRCLTLKKVKKKVKKVVVKANFLYQYQQYDQADNSCGTVVKGNGKSFSLQLVPGRLQVRFGVSPEGFKRTFWGQWTSLAPNGTDLQCGQLTDSPPAPQAELCAWQQTDSLPTSLTGDCGVPIAGSCAWSSPATLHDGTVTAGTVSCPQAPCSYLTNHAPVTWFTSVPITIPYFLSCPPDPQLPGPSGAIVGLVQIRLGHYDANHQLVVDCRASPDGIGVAGFTIPADWGGVVMTDFWLIPDHGGRTLPQYESQTSLFQLTGSRSGCPLNLPSINGG